MKDTFTPKEYARLLELVYLGLYVVARPPDGDVAPLHPPTRRYDELEQKLLDLATPLGCPELVDVGALGHLVPSAKLAGDDRLQKFIGEHNNDTFWHELVTRLADRDLAMQQTKLSLSGEGGPPIDADLRLRELEDAYWAEFEANDLANVVLLRGGKG